MPTIYEYQIFKQLYNSLSTVVRHAVREDDKKQEASFSKLVQFRNYWEIRQSLLPKFSAQQLKTKLFKVLNQVNYSLKIQKHIVVTELPLPLKVFHGFPVTAPYKLN
ncbi:MAG: hypothetical protein KI793_10540 [Rivularia sp. (in: Bacteria)]|nr:hypothetical protein [Rivularia sp. MS3]